MATLNLKKLAEDSDWQEKAREIMDTAQRALEIRKEVILSLFRSGLFPFTEQYMDPENLKGAIGFVGLAEAAQGKEETAAQILQMLKNEIRPDMVFLATPAESAACRLARLDKEEQGYYHNGTSLENGADLADQILVQERLQAFLTGTCGFGIRMLTNLSADPLCLLVNKLITSTTLKNFHYDPIFWMDEQGQRHDGMHGQDTWIRASGSWMPLKKALPNKRKEFEDWLKEQKEINHI